MSACHAFVCALNDKHMKHSKAKQAGYYRIIYVQPLDILGGDPRMYWVTQTSRMLVTLEDLEELQTLEH
jgi:hypothetical protein